MSKTLPQRSRRMTVRKPTIYDCGCLDRVNAVLRESNTVVETCFMMNFSTALQGEGILLRTVKVDSKKRGKPVNVGVNYCPWCGVKYG